MDTLIAATGLGVIRSETPILTDIHLQINAGRITGLIGPSGCGKTTLMRSIVGSQRITSGSLVVDGISAGSAELRGRIGYMSQAPALYTDLTVIENLTYFAELLAVNTARIDEVISQVELGKYALQTPRALSGGQISRLSLAIALLTDPDIFILDEPTVGLDPVLRQSLWDLFRTFAAVGKTFLISSHVMDEAARCDDLILMRDGRILFTGTPSNLLQATNAHSVESAFLALIKQGSL